MVSQYLGDLLQHYAGEAWVVMDWEIYNFSRTTCTFFTKMKETPLTDIFFHVYLSLLVDLFVRVPSGSGCLQPLVRLTRCRVYSPWKFQILSCITWYIKIAEIWIWTLSDKVILAVRCFLLGSVLKSMWLFFYGDWSDGTLYFRQGKRGNVFLTKYIFKKERMTSELFPVVLHSHSLPRLVGKPTLHFHLKHEPSPMRVKFRYIMNEGDQ